MNRLSLHYSPRAHFDIPIFLGRGAASALPSILSDLACDTVHIFADAVAYSALRDTRIHELVAGYPTKLLSAGEVHKSLRSLEQLCDTFFQQGGTKDSCIVALGGGSIGNLAGLAAALVYRGVDLVHVPTTLIGQLDSAVDVKQSVNGYAKNAIGAYYPPVAVIVDPELLNTLPRRQIRSGLAEALKHGFAQSMALVDLVVTMTDERNRSTLDQIIAMTIELKLAHYRESAMRWIERNPVKRLTHIGHSVGKVMESLCPGRISHGEAVGHGMVAESYMSRDMGLLSQSDLEVVVATLRCAGLLPRLPLPCTADAIVARLLREEAQPTFALLAALGTTSVVTAPVPLKVITRALQRWLSAVS